MTLETELPPSSKIWIVFFVLSTLLMATAQVNAQRTSIWQRRDQQLTGLGTAIRARERGDLLFITITEKSEVGNLDQRLLKKQNSSDSEAALGYAMSGTVGSGAGNLSFDQESAANRQFNGNTQFISEREFTDRFTVRVIDTFPNGNLLVGGTRTVTVEGDTRKLILTGVVRRNDVSLGNTIPSQMISDLRIQYASDGPSGAEQKFINQGWLGKRLNRWWPH